MTEGETSEYFERGMISEKPSTKGVASVPLYESTYSMSASGVGHLKLRNSLDGGTIKFNVIESPCLNLEVALTVLTVLRKR